MLRERENAGLRSVRRPAFSYLSGMHRRLFAFFSFATVLSAVLIAIHGYFVDRLIHRPGWGFAHARWLEPFMWGALLLLLVLPFAQRALRPPWTALFAWPAYVWMGTAFYLLLLLAASDLVLWSLGSAGHVAAQTRAVVVLGLSVAVVVLGMLSALGTPRVKTVRVDLDRWPAALNGYRVVQLSDIHIGPILGAGFARRLVKRCNELEADLLAITGDLVDGSVDQLRKDVAPFSKLCATDGVFFVTGNHDHYSGADEWNRYLRQLGLQVLGNEHRLIIRPQGTFALGGVYDRTSSVGDNVAAAFAGAPAHAPRLLLAHHPETFRQGPEHGVDLQLSGHTHDGQMWPFRYLIPLQTRFVAGLYRAGAHVLYVSRGTGFWGPPMRVLAPPEITQLCLYRAGPDMAQTSLRTDHG